MSAFLVNDNHINAIVRWARNQRYFSYQWGTPPSTRGVNGDEQRIAQMLADENLRSVNYRYREKGETNPAVFDHYATNLTPVGVIKACHCLAYQSCEHEGWETSEAKAFLDEVVQDAIRALPGYEEAHWEVPAEEAARRGLS